MYVSHLQYRSGIRFVHVRVGGKNRYIFNLLQIWSLFIGIVLLVIEEEEEDTYNTAFVKSRASYQTIKLQLNMNVSLKTTKDYSLPLYQGIALITANAIVCVFGSLGNLLVCFAIATNPRLCQCSNYLLFSLAVADLIVTLVCEPFLLEMFYNRTFVHECKPNLERLYSISANLSCSASVVHLASISVDNNYSPKWRWLVLDIYQTAKQ